MKIVLVGNFESAFIRMHDEESAPYRNSTEHEYYMDLNRKTDRIYRDGGATFAALADEVSVPWQLDWNVDPLAESCGVRKTTYAKQDPEWQYQYDFIEELITKVIEEHALSARSISHITGLNLSGYKDEVARKFIAVKPWERSNLISAFLRRLLHQIYAAEGRNTYLLVAEPELQIINDLGQILISGSFRHQLPFPDLRGKLIDTETLLDGVLAFSPRDILALEAVRRSAEIRHYGDRLKEELSKGDASDITKATVEAYRRTEIGRKTDRVFEAMTWVAKPIHYVPGLDAIMTVAEDFKDLVNKGAKWKMRYSDWHLIGLKMQTVATEDYFRRLSNRYPE